MERVEDMPGSEKDGAAGTPSGGNGKAKRKAAVALSSNILSGVEIMITATLGQGSLPVSQLLELGPGSVVELETPLDGQLDLTLNGKLIARGELVAVDDRFGVRISEIIPE